MANLIPVEVKNKIGTIEDNLDAVEISIREKVEEYKSIVVTEDTVKSGKNFLADIRKEQKALDDDRKQIKTQWMAPYMAFEERAKKIIALYDEPVKALNSQLTKFEEDRKALKREEIRATYDVSIGADELADWLPLESIYDTKWENATYGGKKIRDDMDKVLTQMKLSVSTIQTMNSKFEEQALDTLKKTRSLQDAIMKINQLQELEKQLEQAKIREEQERERAEQAAREKEAADSKQEKIEICKQVETPEEAPEMTMEGFQMEKRVSYRITIGEDDWELLKQCIKFNNIECEIEEV